MPTFGYTGQTAKATTKPALIRVLQNGDDIDSSKFKMQNFVKIFHFSLIPKGQASLITFHSRQRRAGFTLIELLVGLVVFVVLAVFATQSVSSILKTRSKAEIVKNVRQEAEFAASLMERHLRGSLSVTCVSPIQLSFVDGEGAASSFSCNNLGGQDPYLASGSARLTTTGVSITSCEFTCSTNPAQVGISFTMTQRGTSGDVREKSSINISSQVLLRNQ